MHRLQELVRLHRMGTGAREVARLLAMSPNTERAYREGLAAAGLLEGPADDLPALEALKTALPAKVPPQQVSSLEGWTGVVTQLVARGAQPRAIYDHLRTTDTAFAGSLSAVKRLVARLQREQGEARGRRHPGQDGPRRGRAGRLGALSHLPEHFTRQAALTGILEPGLPASAPARVWVRRFCLLRVAEHRGCLANRPTGEALQGVLDAPAGEVALCRVVAVFFDPVLFDLFAIDLTNSGILPACEL